MMTIRQSMIDQHALRSNLDRIRLMAPHCKVLSMVKADAYGHGLVPVARALIGTDAFGVATLSEAVCLREAGVAQRIVLMSGFSTAEELNLMQVHAIDAVIHDASQIALMAQYKPITLFLWLKVNAGMNRLGFKPENVLSVYQQLRACCPAQSNFPLLTHFPTIENPSYTWMTTDQLDQFQALLRQSSDKFSVCSLMQSAGILNQFNSSGEIQRNEWIRPGISLYGVSPLPGYVGLDHGFQPVMTLRSKLIAVQSVKRGEYIGYGAGWCSPSDKRIGIVAIGYGDGYPRSASNGTPVLIDGVECPLVGRVSMDMLTVDLTPCPHAMVGSDVVLWGQGLAVEHVAAAANTIAYELLCRVTSRVQRIVV